MEYILNLQLVGFTLFYYTYSTWEGKSVYMEDLYVQPDQRGKGTGTKVSQRFGTNSMQFWTK